MQLTHLLTDEQNMLQDTMRKFVDKEVMPIRREMESDYSLVESVLQKMVDLGIPQAGYPPECGGTGPMSTTDRMITHSELGRGDAGLAIINSMNGGSLLIPAIFAGNKAVVERFGPPFCGDKVCYGCLAMTDSSGGCDSENPVLQGRGIATRAKLDGDEWVINGSKTWPPNAGLASVYLTICSTDPSAGDDGIAMIYVPADTPGLLFGKFESKLGYKTVKNGSVSYDNVRVPKEYRLAGPGKDAMYYYGALMGIAQGLSAAASLGMAQGAFDIALNYSGERKSGGIPVREWSLAAGMIADMATRLEAMRGIAFNYAAMVDNADHYGSPLSNVMISRGAIVRGFISENCLFICNTALQLLGSNGISTEYNLEKYVRDCLTAQLFLGGQQITKYRIIKGYYNYVAGKIPY